MFAEEQFCRLDPMRRQNMGNKNYSSTVTYDSTLQLLRLEIKMDMGDALGKIFSGTTREVLRIVTGFFRYKENNYYVM